MTPESSIDHAFAPNPLVPPITSGQLARAHAHLAAPRPALAPRANADRLARK